MGLDHGIMQNKILSSVSELSVFVRNIFRNDIRDNPKALRYGVIFAVALIGVYLRYRLLPGINGDYTIYISNWYDHLHTYGFAGFKDNFANYNFPYLFFLYIATILPIPKLLAVKLISVLFDFILVAGVYKLVKIITKSELRSVFAGLLVFLLPTVFINSAYWGQTDAIYTSFLIFSLVALLSGRYKIMWLLFGVALSFKLQAIFLIPVFAFAWYKKKGEWWGPAISALTFIGLSIPPMLAGRSLKDCLSVYANQYGFEPLLSAHVPNFYYWLPQEYYSVINGAGILFAVAVTILVTYLAIVKMKYSPLGIIFLAAFSAVLIPYILPQMHDRYFYIFEVLLVVLSTIRRRFIPMAITMQAVTLVVYTKTLFGYKEVPFSILAAAVSVLLIFFIFYFVRDHIKIKDSN